MQTRIHLGLIHDKAAVEAARRHQALTEAGIFLLIGAAVVFAALALDWGAISDRLAAALNPPRV